MAPACGSVGAWTQASSTFDTYCILKSRFWGMLQWHPPSLSSTLAFPLNFPQEKRTSTRQRPWSLHGVASPWMRPTPISFELPQERSQRSKTYKVCLQIGLLAPRSQRLELRARSCSEKEGQAQRLRYLRFSEGNQLKKRPSVTQTTCCRQNGHWWLFCLVCLSRQSWHRTWPQGAKTTTFFLCWHTWQVRACPPFNFFFGGSGQASRETSFQETWTLKELVGTRTSFLPPRGPTSTDQRMRIWMRWLEKPRPLIRRSNSLLRRPALHFRCSSQSWVQSSQADIVLSLAVLAQSSLRRSICAPASDQKKETSASDPRQHLVVESLIGVLCSLTISIIFCDAVFARLMKNHYCKLWLRFKNDCKPLSAAQIPMRESSAPLRRLVAAVFAAPFLSFLLRPYPAVSPTAEQRT